MDDITVKELVDLVDSDVSEAENRIQKMFEWHYNRRLLIVKWLLGAAASISVAVLATIFKGKIQANLWQSVLVIVAAIGSFGFGFYRLLLLREVHRNFVAALKLYRKLEQVAPFISKYKDAINR